MYQEIMDFEKIIQLWYKQCSIYLQNYYMVGREVLQVLYTIMLQPISKLIEKCMKKKNVWLYFLLTTEVNFISKSYVLANPKSANFICPWADTKIFCGFKSRCIIRWECKKSTPVSNSVANFWNVIWILNYIYFSPG